MFETFRLFKRLAALERQAEVTKVCLDGDWVELRHIGRMFGSDVGLVQRAKQNRNHLQDLARDFRLLTEHLGVKFEDTKATPERRVCQAIPKRKRGSAHE